MRTPWKGAAILVALAAALACGGDGGSGPSANEVTGTWTVTKMLFVSKASPQVSVDPVALGATAVMVIDPDKSFTVTVSPPWDTSELATGTWKLDGDVFVVTPAGMPFDLQFNVTVTASTIRLAGADVDFDVNTDGTEEPCKLTIEASR